jgi:hypothetical protein
MFARSLSSGRRTVRELGRTIAGQGRRLALKKGSLALFGGGWKSFTGEEISRESLVGMMSDTLGLPPDMIWKATP